tara:strand:- start:299 stop:571 length:273 start_codon:yes stop_codon:yes gene_type:complete
MIPVETDALQALINAEVDKTVQNKVLRLAVAHGNAVSNHKGALDKIKKLTAEVRRLTTTNTQLLSRVASSQDQDKIETRKISLDKQPEVC